LYQLTAVPGKSVHYLIGRDGQVVQLVPEAYIAWHAGNYPVNTRSIGIEHVGLTNEVYSSEEYDASARLVRYLVAKYHIVADRDHIIGHEQVPDPTALDANAPACSAPTAACDADDRYGGIHHHHDPGPMWAWEQYMSLILAR
jgi:N-acetyl-anhydromuramyl-L-alanine amidase AmpD